jgi:N-acetylglutamate synthase/N-acetylornithine aminotransferase
MVCVALTVVSCAAVVRAGHTVVGRARAQTVADAVALAAVTSGQPIARVLADCAQAEHVVIDDDGATVGVSLDVRGFHATAHARRAAEQVAP